MSNQVNCNYSYVKEIIKAKFIKRLNSRIPTMTEKLKKIQYEQNIKYLEKKMKNKILLLEDDLNLN